MRSVPLIGYAMRYGKGVPREGGNESDGIYLSLGCGCWRRKIWRDCCPSAYGAMKFIGGAGCARQLSHYCRSERILATLVSDLLVTIREVDEVIGSMRDLQSSSAM